MQRRSLLDICDKEIGHKGFARFIVLAQTKGIWIDDIREYYEKFKFKADGFEMEYDKSCKNIKGYFKLFENTLFNMKKLAMLTGGK